MYFRNSIFLVICTQLHSMYGELCDSNGLLTCSGNKYCCEGNTKCCSRLSVEFIAVIAIGAAVAVAIIVVIIIAAVKRANRNKLKVMDGRPGMFPPRMTRLLLTTPPPPVRTYIRPQCCGERGANRRLGITTGRSLCRERSPYVSIVMKWQLTLS